MKPHLLMIKLLCDLQTSIELKLPLQRYSKHVTPILVCFVIVISLASANKSALEAKVRLDQTRLVKSS